MFVTRPPEKVTFTILKVTFSREKMTFTILKVTFSDEKVIFSRINMRIMYGIQNSLYTNCQEKDNFCYVCNDLTYFYWQYEKI